MKKIHPKAFTLIELVMVITLVGILSAVILPRINLLSIFSKNAYYKIKSDIRYAQGYSLYTQKRTWISFDLAAGVYQIFFESSPGIWSPISDPLTKKDYYVDLKKDGYSNVSIVSTFFDGANTGLIFDASGTPSSCDSMGGGIFPLSGQGVIALSGGQTVTIEPGTGQVE